MKRKIFKLILFVSVLICMNSITVYNCWADDDDLPKVFTIAEN